MAAPTVKLERESDADLSSWTASQESKKKVRARMVSPVAVSSDESGSDGFSDTPKAKGRPSGTNPKALKNQQ